VTLAAGSQLNNNAEGHQLLRADPKKKEAAKKEGGDKTGLMKKMPLKAQEQGYSGKHVKHADGKTAAADWQSEYGNEAKQVAPPPSPRSGSIRSGALALAVPVALLLRW